MKLQDYDISRQCQAAVLSSERITPQASPDEVREIVLDVKQPGFGAAAGQNIGVLAPGQSEFGQEHHFRLYSVADVPEPTADGSVQFPICVRRCSYVDEYSGERYQGVASNYLCDLQPGDTLTITGPYGSAFEVPDDNQAILILIATGTGIAPFRAFVKKIYREKPDFEGRIHLFHGGRTGLDLIYRNDVRDDFALYYDRETFEAIEALSERPHWDERPDWSRAIEARAEEIGKLLADPHTRVFVAGLENIRDELDGIFAKVAGSDEKWARIKAALEDDGRWVELLY